MEANTQLLALLDRPAFFVEEGRITAANDAARARLIEPDCSVADLLSSGREEFASFDRGFLCLELDLPGGKVPATVTALDDGQLFTLEPEQLGDELRLLALAARELREPLSDVMLLAESLPPDTEQAAALNRGLHRLLRLVGNMTPAPAFRPQLQDVGALLLEFRDRATPGCERLGTEFSCKVPYVPVYTLVDWAMLERALHNLLSNSLKFSPGCQVKLQLTQTRNRFTIVFWDSGGSLPTDLRDPFARYLRRAELEDPRCGMGMGLRLVRDAALAHGGTALMHAPEEGGVRFTMTIPVNQDISNVRSPRLQISYTGERDPLLIELSDVLPHEFYKL